MNGVVEKLENKDTRSNENIFYLPSVIYSGIRSEIHIFWLYYNECARLVSVRELKKDVNLNKEILSFGYNEKNSITIRVFRGTTKEYGVFLKHNRRKNLVRIQNSGFDVFGDYVWKFRYSALTGQENLLQEVIYPGGRKDSIQYVSYDNPFNLISPDNRKLFSVVIYKITPQFISGVKEIVTEYTFIWGSNGYQSVESYLGKRRDIIKKITRKYNKFHLLINEIIDAGSTKKSISYRYDYCDDTKDLAQQSIKYQCVNQIKTTFSDISRSTVKTRDEIVKMEYDDYGYLTMQINANNSKVCFSYTTDTLYGRQIIDIPNNLRLIKSISLIYPENNSDKIYKEFEYETISEHLTDYEAIDNLLNYKIFPVKSDLYINDTLVNRTLSSYNKNMENNFLFGKLASQTHYCFDKATIKNFNWSYKGGELTLRTVTKTNDLSSEELSTWDGGTGLLKTHIDSLNRMMLYEHDGIGRVLNVTLKSNVDDKNKSKKFQYSYKYKVKDVSGILYYEIETTDLHYGRYYERYDGLGRLQMVALQQSDSDSEKVIHTYKYNELSQLEVEEHFSYQDNNIFRFLNIYTYDGWGNIAKIRHDDGVEENIVTDVINRERTHWLAHGKEVIDKKIIVFDSNNQPVIYKRQSTKGNYSQVFFERDYCGRLVKKTDELGRVTHYKYDLLDRVSTIILPDNSVIEKSFCMYSEDQLIEKMSLTSSNGNTYELGVQIFDDLNRLTESQSYGVVKKFRYSLNYHLPDEISFADGSTIFYKNDYGLKWKVLSSEDKGKTFRKEFLYSHNDDSLIETHFTTEHSTYIEKIDQNTATNSIVINTKFTHDNNVFDLKYMQENYYNNDGISRIIDETGTEYRYSHDVYGRLTEVNTGRVKTEIQYDNFSRISHITESDEEGKTVIQLLYDEFNREVERRITLFSQGGEPGEDLIQNMTLIVTTRYYPNNLIKSRVIEDLNDIQNIIRLESFRYDNLDRVNNYQCRGEFLTTDKTGKGIRSVDYTFDDVGNISETDTVYLGDSRKVVTFNYDKNNPFILHSVQEYNSSDTTMFEFDTSGNLIRKKINHTNDQKLSHDTEVIYKYDLHSHLSSVENTTIEKNKTEVNSVTEYVRGSTENIFFTKTLSKKGKFESISTFRGYNNEVINAVNFRNKEEYTKINALFGNPRSTLVKNKDNPCKTKIVANSSGTPIYLTNYKKGKFESSSYPTISLYGGGAEKAHPVGFNGCIYDENAGGYQMGPRLYDPEYFRFTTPDSLSPFHGGNVNPYIYCNNNPVNNNDNTGYFTSENWKVAVYMTAGLSIFSGVTTLAAALAMSSVMMTVFSLFEIGSGMFAIMSVQGNSDASELAISGAISVLSLGTSAFNITGMFKYPLSKNLKKFFDFNRNHHALSTLSIVKERKKIMGLKYLGHGVTVFNDTYKNKPRLNIYAHGKRTSLVEARPDNSGRNLKVNQLTAADLDWLIRSTGAINYDNYASIRLIACHSADFGFLTPPIGYDLHQITGLPVKAFQGKVTCFGYPPDILQHSFEQFSHDPHALQNIQKQFASRFEVVHNASYSPQHFI